MLTVGKEIKMNCADKAITKLAKALSLLNEADNLWKEAISTGEIVLSRPKPKPENEDCPYREITDCIKTALESLDNAVDCAEEIGLDDDYEEVRSIDIHPVLAHTLEKHLGMERQAIFLLRWHNG